MKNHEIKEEKRSSTFTIILMLCFICSSLYGQTHFHKWYKNPFLPPKEGTFYSGHTDPGSMIFEDGLFKMWFNGISSDDVWQVGYAESTDGMIWDIHPNPVLSPGAVGDYFEETVVSHTVIHDDSLYKMWYWGNFRYKDDLPTLRIGYATSPDGLNWIKYEGNPVLDIGSEGSWDFPRVWCPSVVKIDSVYHMWYSGNNWDDPEGFQTGYATSNDGMNWTKYEGNPVSSPGPIDSWDDFSQWNTFVTYNGDFFEIWYCGATNNDIWPNSRIGYATSNDGIEWIKDLNNPLLVPGIAGTFDAGWVETPRFFVQNKISHLWYQGVSSKDFSFQKRAIGYARDFSQITHIDSIGLFTNFSAPGTEVPANISVYKPAENAVFKAHFLDLNDNVIFSEELQSDLDGFTSPDSEGTFKISMTVENPDDSSQFNSLHWNIVDYFTTKGPVKIDSVTSVIKSGNFIDIRLYIKNEGQYAKILAPRIKISAADSLVTIINGLTNYGDINPGQTVPGYNFHSIKVDHLENGLIIPLYASIYSEGEFFWRDSIDIEIIIDSIEDEKTGLPYEFALAQNHPNPFNPSTKIQFSIPKTEKVTIDVYNALGQHIETLLNKSMPAGNHEVNFHAENLPTGVYFYRITAGEFGQVRKMILLR